LRLRSEGDRASARRKAVRHATAIRVFDEAGNVIETHEHAATSKSGERRETKSRHAVEAWRLLVLQRLY
jgi:hypothetical protein